jgi:hypothetical protein
MSKYKRGESPVCMYENLLETKIMTKIVSICPKLKSKSQMTPKKKPQIRLLATDKHFENKVIDGKRGFEISVTFEIEKLEFETCTIIIRVYDNNKKPLQNLDSALGKTMGFVTITKPVVVAQSAVRFTDFRVFVSNDELNLTKRVRHSLYYQVVIFFSKDVVEKSELLPFHITP